ncbi:hypothetical protein PsorP6_004166 [Peronosclerospora sorghi]|uniref:Uncharacterized protein n=1 Tax=Peronosclerospora sorghi TaxID=230839 RepID=A0ACC0VKJ2_9STRA|nr:hypothetical protein PsorP6_004166 [Peronosclerospora sorghi]
MESRFQEHKIISNAVKEDVKTLGCSLVTTIDYGANTLMCVRYPLALVLKRGVSLAGGLHKAIQRSTLLSVAIPCHTAVKLERLEKKLQAIIPVRPACGYALVYNVCPVHPKCQVYFIGTMLIAFACGYLPHEA